MCSYPDDVRRLGKFLGLSRAQWTIHVKNRHWTIRARRIKHHQRDVDVKRHRGKSSGFPTFQTLWPSFSIYQAEPDHRGTCSTRSHRHFVFSLTLTVVPHPTPEREGVASFQGNLESVASARLTRLFMYADVRTIQYDVLNRSGTRLMLRRCSTSTVTMQRSQCWRG